MERLENDMNNFYRILGGHIYFQTLVAAVRLDLFTKLSKRNGQTLSELAIELKIEEKPTRILVLGCVSLGLLEKREEKYYITSFSTKILSRDSSDNLIPIIEWQHYINYKSLFYFTESLQSNQNVGLKEFKGNEPTLYERLTYHPELEVIFQDAMESISKMSNWMLPKYVDFSQFKYLVDVGGGNGTNIIEIAKVNPKLNACVFDSASVCEIAKENFKKSEVASRLSVMPGNCFEDSFPEKADCILFCHFFTIWSEEKNKILLKKAFDSLPKGGAVIIFNMMQHDDKTGPLSAALGSPYFLTLATGEGMLYTWSEYELWMKQIGFKEVKKRELVLDHGVIIGIK